MKKHQLTKGADRYTRTSIYDLIYWETFGERAKGSVPVTADQLAKINKGSAR